MSTKPGQRVRIGERVAAFQKGQHDAARGEVKLTPKMCSSYVLTDAYFAGMEQFRRNGTRGGRGATSLKRGQQ